ncbi:hypothetical protein H6F98_00600 [Microcoleus sp. FACHB-SPT15]|uniref:hypothetical protein n=1 Tax=Microcoleus sp. FACHB-SPT15 TaxID=2692830 RepID=UPI00177F0A7A|nr:hypothetical protein [Microcoleus sp. FACHB-SPT15]MBD1803977.1 hypothetical protein [Microcoleus sp. FACHB-SPT15]
MSYSQFSLSEVQELFNLSITEGVGIFAGLPSTPISDYLQETLNYNISLALAINSEKARSELIIAPVLVELKKLTGYGLFSGVEFNVDPSQGLVGYVDFLVSRDPEQLFVKAPVVTIVEAKKEDINNGLGQCVATLVAAQIFNERKGLIIPELLGTVTTGSAWKFLKLSGKSLSIDLDEYTIKDAPKILGILSAVLA